MRVSMTSMIETCESKSEAMRIRFNIARRRARSTHERLALAGVLLMAFGLVSCGRGERTITETRVLPEQERNVRLDASSRERFGLGDSAANEGGSAAGNPFRWEKPGGWEEIAPTSMRVANFRLGEGGMGECYLTALPGAGGGMAANINRWRRQMGLEAWTDEEIAALETTTLLNQPAPFAAFDGTFSGMGGAGTKENYRLLGAILSYDQFTLFVKMTGPVDVVRKEEKAFKDFCASLNIVSPGAGAAR